MKIDRKTVQGSIPEPVIRLKIPSPPAARPAGLGVKPASATESVKPIEPSDPRDLPGWSALLLREESTDVLSHEFSFPDGHGKTFKKEVGAALTASEVVKKLREYTTALPRRPHIAAAGIDRLRDAANAVAPLIKAKKPGWKPDSVAQHPSVFVTPNGVYPNEDSYRWSSNATNQLGASRGTLRSWQREVASIGKQSNYVAFCIMAAAAAQLVRFATLSEFPVFNLVGDSSVGKTTAARAALSTCGPPETIKSWDFKSRALEEVAADYNDFPLILNAAERTAERERVLVLNRITHMLAEGTGTTRSSYVQDHLPNHTWRVLVISTSNLTGAEMAGASFTWEDQDRARFIDIPVNGAEVGGIFDRLAKPLKENAATDLVKELEQAVQNHYGTFLPAWINYLMTIDVQSIVAAYMKEYLDADRPSPGVDERIATKFALVYAAGKMGVDAGLLPWHTRRIDASVGRIHQRSADARGLPSSTLANILIQIAANLDNKLIFPDTVRGGRVTAKEDFLGVKVVHGGQSVVGLRTDRLSTRFGATLINPIISWLRQKGLLIQGQGGKSGCQLAIELIVSGAVINKPRFLLVREDQLRTELAKLNSR